MGELEDEDDEKKPDPIQDIKDTFNMLISGRMLYCMPMIIWSAWSVNIFAAVFVVMNTRTMKHTYKDCEVEDVKDCSSEEKRLRYALFTMTTLGVGEILGGIVLGKIRDALGNKLALIILIIETLVGVGLVIIVNNSNNYYALNWVMTFVWGF